jgi:polysaccharide biosynthesis protein PslG
LNSSLFARLSIVLIMIGVLPLVPSQTRMPTTTWSAVAGQARSGSVVSSPSAALGTNDDLSPAWKRIEMVTPIPTVSATPSGDPSPISRPIAAASQAPAPPSSPYAGKVGLDSHLIWGSESSAESELQRAQAGGVHWVREDFPWNSIEPSRGSFNWSMGDNLMTAAANSQSEVLAIIDYSASWASNCGGNTRCPPSSANDFANFAVAVLERYGTGGSFWASHPALRASPVTAIEVWNEPFGYWDWAPNPDPAAYARLARTTALAVHAYRPSVTVLASGDVLEVRTDGAIVSWLQSVIAADPTLNQVINAWSVHPYPSSRDYGPRVSRSDPRWDYGRIAVTHQVDPSLPIWITEVGWSTATNCLDCVSEATQASNVHDAVLRAVQEFGAYVPHIFIYSLDLSNGVAGDREGNYGLRRSDNTFKPAWNSLVGLIQNGA